MSDSKWTIDAGPRIAKQFREALRALHRAGQFYHLETDDGPKEAHRPFLPIRQEAVDSEQAIGERYEWTITRKNYLEAIADLGVATKLVPFGTIDMRTK